MLTQTLVKLSYIQNQMSFTKKMETVADALAYGYVNCRFPALFDKILQNWNTKELSGIVQDIADQWDGENYFSGIIWTTNKYYNEVLKPQIEINEEIISVIDNLL